MNLVVLRSFISWVTFLVMLPAVISAQEITMAQTLDYINGKLGSGYEVDVNSGIIIARFSEGVEVYREDQVLYKALDINSMHYDSGQRMFIINCKAGKECVDRQLSLAGVAGRHRPQSTHIRFSRWRMGWRRHQHVVCDHQ